MTAIKQNFLEQCYKDERGKITLFQSPNLPILTWLFCAIVTRLMPSGMLHTLFMLIGFGALFTWAWLELFSGSNYLRRVLGFVVLFLLIYNHL